MSLDVTGYQPHYHLFIDPTCFVDRSLRGYVYVPKQGHADMHKRDVIEKMGLKKQVEVSLCRSHESDKGVWT